MVASTFSHFYEFHHNLWALLSISLLALESISSLHIHPGEHCQGFSMTMSNLDSKFPPSTSWVTLSWHLHLFCFCLHCFIEISNLQRRDCLFYPICISYLSLGYLVRNLRKEKRIVHKSQKKYLVGSGTGLSAHRPQSCPASRIVFPDILPSAKNCTKGKKYNKTRYLWKNTEA